MSLDSPPRSSRPHANGYRTGVGNSEAGAQESLADLLRQPAFQEFASLFRQFIAAAGNGHGAAGIAKVLQQHTGRAVIVEDPTGQVIASSGVDRLSCHSDVAPRAACPRTPIMLSRPSTATRWVAVACPRGRCSVPSAFSTRTSRQLAGSVRARAGGNGPRLGAPARPQRRRGRGRVVGRLRHRAARGLRRRTGSAPTPPGSATTSTSRTAPCSC